MSSPSPLLRFTRSEVTWLRRLGLTNCRTVFQIRQFGQSVQETIDEPTARKLSLFFKLNEGHTIGKVLCKPNDSPMWVNIGPMSAAELKDIQDEEENEEANLEDGAEY